MAVWYQVHAEREKESLEKRANKAQLSIQPPPPISLIAQRAIAAIGVDGHVDVSDPEVQLKLGRLIDRNLPTILKEKERREKAAKRKAAKKGKK